MNQDFWPFCLAHLEQELPQQQFNTWIKTLQVVCGEAADGGPTLTLTAPNRFVMQWVRERYLRRIGELGEEFHGVPLQLDLQLPAPGAARTPVKPVASAAPAAGSAHADPSGITPGQAADAAPARESRPAAPAPVTRNSS
ncbi:MAG: DnaA N-terminal domain-containing protein, partial [Azoarcus sp.]|nr:DnaA N-terminal domain-containing protein [Azoarcus sp.]